MMIDCVNEVDEFVREINIQNSTFNEIIRSESEDILFPRRVWGFILNIKC